MEDTECCHIETDGDFLEFAGRVRRLEESRNHKIKNSYGVYDGFKFYRKNRPKGHKYVLNESQYFSIIRRVNELLGENLLNGEDIIFPYKMGRLEVRKYEAKITIDGKKIKTNLPIDWDRTLRLWYEDEESYKDKTLVKAEEKEIYKIYYNRNIAEFINKCFYEFKVNRSLKRGLKQGIKEGKLDAFIIK